MLGSKGASPNMKHATRHFPKPFNLLRVLIKSLWLEKKYDTFKISGMMMVKAKEKARYSAKVVKEFQKGYVAQQNKIRIDRSFTKSM